MDFIDVDKLRENKKLSNNKKVEKLTSRIDKILKKYKKIFLDTVRSETFRRNIIRKLNKASNKGKNECIITIMKMNKNDISFTNHTFISYLLCFICGDVDELQCEVVRRAIEIYLGDLDENIIVIAKGDDFYIKHKLGEKILFMDHDMKEHLINIPKILLKYSLSIEEKYDIGEDIKIKPELVYDQYEEHIFYLFRW